MLNQTLSPDTESSGNLSQASRQSAAGLVFHGIVNGLAEQKFVPGQRLVEVDLAAQFGVSRNSVREALQRLAAEGVVDLLRNKGAAICSLTLQETMEVLDVAERMTGLLARSAARSIAAGASSAPIKAAMRQLEAADQSHNADAFAQARRSLYRALLSTSGSRELQRIFPSIQMPIVYAQHRPASLQAVRMRDYQSICKAILSGNEAAADEAAMLHVRNVRKAISEQIAPAN